AHIGDVPPALGQAGALQGVVDVEVGPAQAAAARLEAEAHQRIGDDAVLAGHAAVVLVRLRQVDAARRLLQVLAGAPLVAVATGGNEPQVAIAHLPGGAPRQRAGPVSRHAADALHHAVVRTDELLRDAAGVDRAGAD